MLYFNSSIGSLAIKPNDLTPKAADKLSGPELLPTKKSEFFNANTIPPKFLKAMYNHPLTDKGLADFLADWKNTGQSIL